MRTELKKNHEWYQVQINKDGYSIIETRQRPISKSKKQDVVKPVVKKKSFKKGTKQIKALELYKQYVVGKSYTREQFVEVLMNDLEMTKAGATTYFYNCKRGV